MYGNHLGGNVCRDLSQYASPRLGSDRPTCEDLNVRHGFKMTLAESLKYGNINVHSVK